MAFADRIYYLKHNCEPDGHGGQRSVLSTIKFDRLS